MSNLLHHILPPPRKELCLYTNYIGLSINHTKKEWSRVLTNSRPPLTLIKCKNYNPIKLLTACNIKI